MTRPIGRFSLVLHGHLPYVLSHGHWPHGSDMLCECAAESYLPLLDVLNRLVAESHSPRLTIGLTPVLTEQLADADFAREFEHYLHVRIESARENEEGFRRHDDGYLASLARRWQDHYYRLLDAFTTTYGRDIVGAFRALQDAGHIEIMTSMATHAYSPLIGSDIALQAQVQQAVTSYRRHFGAEPRGFWLPECGYRPRYEWTSPLPDAGPQTAALRKGVEEFLAEAGLRYFFVDSHLLAGGATLDMYLSRFGALSTLWERFRDQYPPAEATHRSPYRPYLVSSAPEGNPPIAVLARDPRTGLQVWSGEWGYPGDSWYLDFHKKHIPGGLRYWRVTSPKIDLAQKEPYSYEKAAERVPENAGHFCGLVKEILAGYQQEYGEAGVVCSPYDAELFGHWWFEGPEWIYQVLRGLSEDPEVELATCSEVLDAEPPRAAASLPEGSWGQGGFHWIWLNEWTEWIWKRVYQAEQDMEEVVREFGTRHDQEMQSILRQLGRELLLLEASDWQFLISTWSARDYAEQRAQFHSDCFQRLGNMARRYGRGERVDQEDWTFLGDCEARDALFTDINPAWWTKLDHPPEG